MRITRQSEQSFNEFDRALEAAKTAMSGSDKTLILPKDSPLASIFNGRRKIKIEKVKR